jgi:hypothetical protein
MAPRAGFEPATNRLTAGCSTAELPGNDTPFHARNAVAYNKAAPALKALGSNKSFYARLPQCYGAAAFVSGACRAEAAEQRRPEATPGIEQG